MKRSSFLSVLAGAALLAATATPALAGVAQCTWANPSDGNHLVISNGSNTITTLKGVVQSSQLGLRYKWKFGDGKPDSPIYPVIDPYVIEINHIYPSTTNKTYTATLSILPATGTTVISTDTYKVSVVASSAANLRTIAIEDGLWYIHTQLNHHGAKAGAPVLVAEIDRDYETGVILAGQGFIDAGFLATGSLDNPYTEDVGMIVNFVTERLGIMSITDKEGAHSAEERTGTMIDGLGVYHRSDEAEFAFGGALKLLATCGYTTQKPVAVDDTWNFSGGAVTSLTQWTFDQIIQQMVDYLAWSQLVTYSNDYSCWTCTSYDEWGNCVSSGPAPPKKRPLHNIAPGTQGGWPYWSEGWGADEYGNVDRNRNGAYGDVSIAYWTVGGLKAAEVRGAVVPAYVKSEILAFVTRVFDANGYIPFGPAVNFKLVERAGLGLVLLKYTGVTSPTDSRVVALRQFIIDNWNKHILGTHQDHPEADTVCVDSSLNTVDCTCHWAPGGNPAGFWLCDVRGECDWRVAKSYDELNLFGFKTISEGLSGYNLTTTDDYKARYRTLLINNQLVNGAWEDYNWGDGSPFGTAWAIATLNITQ